MPDKPSIKERKRRRKETLQTGEKRCTVCFKMLPINMFQKQAGRFLGLKYKCKLCAKKYDAARYKLKKAWHIKLVEDKRSSLSPEEKRKESQRSWDSDQIEHISYSMDKDEQENAKKDIKKKIEGEWKELLEETQTSLPQMDIIEMKDIKKQKIAEAKKMWEEMKKEKQNNLSNEL